MVSIVMKLGAEKCQVGLSCDAAPTASIRTLVGRPLSKRADLREFYVGDEADLKDALLNVRRPLRKGRVDRWDDMTLIWQHAFRDLLRVDPEEHPVLLSEQPLVPQVNREKMTQVLFETFKVPKVYIAQQPLLTLLSVGRTQGLVLDSGLEATYAVPVFDGHMIREGIQRVDLGGQDLTAHMKVLLEEKGVKTKYAKHVVHRLCYVASDIQLELLTNPDLQQTFQLPDGQVVKVDSERVMVPEGLFNPSLLGSETLSLPVLTSGAILACPSDLRERVAAEVVLSGGPCRLPGLAGRLQMETERLLGSLGVGVRGRESGFQPSAWLGGAVLAQLGSFHDMWISREEYDEHGPSIVHEKCDII